MRDQVGQRDIKDLIKDIISELGKSGLDSFNFNDLSINFIGYSESYLNLVTTMK